MKKIFIIIVVLFMFAAVSCKSSPDMNLLSVSSGRLTVIHSIDTIDSKGVSGLNNFAIRLFDQLHSLDENVFISPASIYLALGMTYNGAAGKTANDMAGVLSTAGISLDEYDKFCRDLQYLISGNNKSKFEIANSIWIRDTFKDSVKQDFINNNKDYFGAMIATLDFGDPKAVDTINSWVNNNTKGKIKKAIDGSISPYTVMYLINTIYFKANWQSPFKASDTKDADFITPQETKKIKFMEQQASFGYIENSILQGINLKYEDGKTSMFILLPKGNLSDLFPEISVDNLNMWINDIKNNSSVVNLHLPKVTLEYEAQLKQSLSMLGMSDAFSDNADFSNIAGNAKEQGLCIGEITHKSFLDIDEKGTEAAAMTKVEMRTTSMPDTVIEMNVDHPFILGIIDDKSNTILFLGSVTNPQ